MRSNPLHPITDVLTALVLALAVPTTVLADQVVDELISYAADVEPLFLDQCAACHNPDKPKADLVLDEGRGWDSLVDKHSTQDTEAFLVVPGDPEASYLWLKVSHEQEIGKGMPRTLFGSTKLGDEELELIRRWIAGGAQP